MIIQKLLGTFYCWMWDEKYGYIVGASKENRSIAIENALILLANKLIIT
jgi:hypothetical protein